jgi:hypothetical protein
LKFKHLFEKKARPTHGKYVTFFRSWGFWGYRAAGWPKNRSLLRNLPIAAALKAVSPKAVGDRAIKLSDRGKEGALPALGLISRFKLPF